MYNHILNPDKEITGKQKDKKNKLARMYHKKTWELKNVKQRDMEDR